MITQAPKQLKLIAALLFVLSAIGLMVFLWVVIGGAVPLQPQGYRFHVLFDNATTLVPGNDVRISGVDVGKVVAVKPVGQRADATIQMLPEYAPIPSDTRAILREKTLLGETFVALSYGNHNGPFLADGARLPSAQVQPTQTLDQLLDSFDPTVRAQLQHLLKGGSGSLAGGGAALNAALGNTDATTAELASLSQLLERQRPAVRQLIKASGSVLNTVGASSSQLRSLVTAADKVLTTTARRNRALDQTVRELAPLLPVLRTATGHVQRALALADPTLRKLIPVAPLLAPTLSNLIQLAPQVKALMTGAHGLIATARRALPVLQQAAGQLTPLFHAILPMGEQLAPIISYVSDYRQEILATMANLGSLARATDTSINGGQKSYLRAMPIIGQEFLYGQAKRPPLDRHNAYHAPGELAQLATVAGLAASDCANAQGTACHVQGGWKFEGLTQYYPHLQPAAAPTAGK